MNVKKLNWQNRTYVYRKHFSHQRTSLDDAKLVRFATAPTVAQGDVDRSSTA